MSKKIKKAKTTVQKIAKSFKALTGSKLKASILKPLEPPYVQYSTHALNKIKYIVNKVDTEVGWMGLVEEIKTTEGSDMYYIVDICLAEQAVTGTECEISDKGVAYAQEKLFDDNPDSSGYIGYWGHSHVNMPVTPSETDVETAMDFYNIDNPFVLITAIHNKTGNINADIYDFKKQLFYDKVKTLVDSALENTIQEELDKDIDELITETIYTYTPPKSATENFLHRSRYVHNNDYSYPPHNYNRMTTPTDKNQHLKYDDGYGNDMPLDETYDNEDPTLIDVTKLNIG
jgi:hypothetical protein